VAIPTTSKAQNINIKSVPMVAAADIISNIKP
jgi:hypothetical protein